MKYYESKFGKGTVQGMIPRMKAVAEECGIRMEYGGYVGNTLDSHRLIWKAREIGGSDLQDKVVDQLFRAYFEENESLGEQKVLEDCASRAGFDRSHEFLSDAESGTREVQSEKQEYGRAYQCTGVPMFIVDGKFKLSGAQEPEAFSKVFERL